MICLPTHLKFHGNRRTDRGLYSQSLQRQIRSRDLIRLPGRSPVAWHAECQFLLHAVRIIDLNGMADSIAGKGKHPPVPRLFDKIAAGELPVLHLGHITERTVRLASLLHIQGKLQGRDHMKSERDHRRKQKRRQRDRQNRREIAPLIFPEIFF